MEIKVVPTIFVYDQPALEDRLELYESLTDLVQLDVADSEFTTQPTLDGDRIIEQPTTLKRDLHLMVNEPIEWLALAVENAIETVTGHIEMMGNQGEFVAEAKNLGLKTGLAVDLDTKIDDLDWSVAESVDQLLIMAIRAGKEEQRFHPEALDKVKSLRKKGFTRDICVDGGVNEKTIAAAIKAGANMLAVGSALWQAEDVGEALKRLQQLAQNSQ